MIHANPQLVEDLIGHAIQNGLYPRHKTYYLHLSGGAYIELVSSLN